MLVHCRGKNKVFPSVLAAAMVEEMRKSGLRVVLMDEHTTRLDLEKHWSECKMEIDVEVTPVFLSKGIVRARRNQEPGSGVPVPLRTFCLFCAQLCEVYAFQQPSDSHYMGQLSRYRDEIIVNLEELSPTEEEQEGWATAGVKPRKSKVKGVKSQEAASQPLPPPSSEKDKQEELDVLERELEQLRLKKKRLELAKRVREARKEVEELEGELK